MSEPRRARGEVPTIPTITLWQRIWRPFWALPAAICAAGIAAGILLPELDRRLSQHLPYLFQGGPDGARGMLSTIASAMISVTGLVFSITMVVLQLASSQFTPRILGEFLAKRITQVTLGVFTASFVFSLTVLRSVQGATDTVSAFVPQLSVTVAFLLVLATSVASSPSSTTSPPRSRSPTSSPRSGTARSTCATGSSRRTSRTRVGAPRRGPPPRVCRGASSRRPTATGR